MELCEEKVDLAAMTCEQLRYDYMTFDRCKTWAFEKVQTDPRCQAATMSPASFFITFDVGVFRIICCHLV